MVGGGKPVAWIKRMKVVTSGLARKTKLVYRVGVQVNPFSDG